MATAFHTRSASGLKNGVDQEWIVLQRKIFSRWCKQKLSRRPEVKVEDIVNDIADGNVLIALIEELSDKKFPGKHIAGPITMRIKQIENLGNALKFTWDSGVQMTLKPSPEQLADKDINSTLGLIWAIMLKFIKIGDDDDSQQLNARDALLLWAKNKCEGYSNVGAIESFKKTSRSPFHNGMALCAIVHKHRPALMPAMGTLDAANALKNIELAQDAAFEYFNLEKYITPLEVTKLDENSMVIYVSEFYYGIAEQRKIDLAGKRITKLIKLTQENDRLKAEFTKTAGEYKERLARVEATLGDRTIDDTMAGAKHRIELFYKYKTEDKNILLGNQLDLEANFNNLAMRLAHHKRPEFIPPEGASLKDVEAALAKLERAEQERSVALHAELNRQIRLASLAAQHVTLHESLQKWCADKENFLNTHPVIESVSAAQLQLRLLEAFVKEAAAARETSLKRLHTMGDELASERFEFVADARAREATSDARFAGLDELAKARLPVLQDDLARETYKQTVRLLYKEYCEKYAAIMSGWVEPKRAYLSTFEVSHSVSDAQTHLSLLDAYEAELAVGGARQLADLQSLRKRIFEAKHESKWSTYEFDHTVTQDPKHEANDPAARQAVADHEAEVLKAWEELAALCAKKRTVLDDHLAREQYSERSRILASSLGDKSAQLQKWVEQGEAYLNTWPEVHSSAEARTQLSVLQAYDEDLARTVEVRVAEFHAAGAELLARKYESELSNYTYESTHSTLPAYAVEKPELRTEVEARQKQVDEQVASLREKAAHKRKVMDDHLARELYAEETRVVSDVHSDKYAQLQAYVAKSEAYLGTWPEVHSSAEARTQLTALSSFDKELAGTTEARVGEFRAIGATLLGRKYATELSMYEFEHAISKQFPAFEVAKPERRAETESRLKQVDEQFVTLAKEAEHKRAVLDDHLARELYAEETRTLAATLADKFAQLEAYIAKGEAYLSSWPEVHSSTEAQAQLTQVAAFEKEHARMVEVYQAEFRALGAELLAREYKTEYSSYTYEVSTSTMPKFEVAHPEQRQEAERKLRHVDEKFAAMAEAMKKKRAVVEDHCSRELYADETRVAAVTHSDMYSQLARWIAESETYLGTWPEIRSSNEARTQLTLLDNFDKELARAAERDVVEFRTAGSELLAREYKTELSSYAYEKTESTMPKFVVDVPERRAETQSRLAEVDAKVNELREKAKGKRAVLDDHLAREQYAEETRVLAHMHADQHAKLQAWVAQKEEYLAAREVVHSVADATALLALLEAFDREQAVVQSGEVAALVACGKSLLARSRKTEESSYEFEHTTYNHPKFDNAKPEERAAVGEREAWVASKMAALTEASHAKRAVLDDHLAREREAERVRMSARQQQDAHEKLLGWFGLKEQYLVARPPIASVAEASAQLTLLDRHQDEAEGVISSSVATNAELGRKILGEKYASSLSSFVFDHIVYSQPQFDQDVPEAKAALEARLAESDARVAKVRDLRAQLRKELEAALALEIEKERLRLEYAHAAHEFSKWVRDSNEALAIESFGFTLDEVRAHGEVVKTSAAQLKETVQSKLGDIKKIIADMDRIKVGENVYSKITEKDLDELQKTLEAAIATRDAAYAKELQRQIENDDLCKEFAGKADPFSHHIIERKDAITKSKGELEEQLKMVVDEIAAAPSQEPALAAMRELNTKMEARGITNNRHTTLTLKDVEVQWQQYSKFLGAKKTMLEAEIEHTRLRGVTQEQMHEIEENFKRFDKDGNGSIDRKELTACLYSLGEERSSSEIREILTTYGDPKTNAMSAPQFRELMLHILGDSDTKQDVITGFQLILRGSATAPDMKELGKVCPAPDVQYFETTAPKAAPAGYDYVAWVETMFSR